MNREKLSHLPDIVFGLIWGLNHRLHWLCLLLKRSHLFIYLVCMYMCVGVHALEEVRGQLEEVHSMLQTCRSQDQTEVVMPGSKCLYLLSLLAHSPILKCSEILP